MIYSSKILEVGNFSLGIDGISIEAGIEMLSLPLLVKEVVESVSAFISGKPIWGL
jgi:hypothetical protein